MYNIEYVHKLSFIFMYPLNHDIIHSIYPYLNPLCLLHILLQLSLALLFDSQELAYESLIPCTGDDLLDHAHVRDPVVVIADGLRDELREAGVAAVEPPPRGHSVRHVQELVREQLVEVPEH